MYLTGSILFLLARNSGWVVGFYDSKREKLAVEEKNDAF